MGFYVGSTRYKVILDSVLYCVNIYSSSPITNSAKLLSSDNYILKDVNGLYLTVSDIEKYQIQLSTLSDEILQDSNKSYLIIKEEDE